MNEDENHIVAEIVREMLSNNNYDTKSIPKQYIPKIHAVLTAAKQDAIAKGQLPVVKQLQSVLSTIPNTNGANFYHVNSLLDQKSKKRTIQTRNKFGEKTTPRYKSKLLSTSNSRQNLSVKKRPISGLESKNDDFVAFDFESDFDDEKTKRIINSSPQTAKLRTIQKNPKKIKLFTDDQLDLALEKMVNGNSFIPEPDVLPELIDYSKRKIDSLIENGELIRAQKYEDVYQQLQSSRNVLEGCNTKSGKMNTLTNHYNKANKNLKNAKINMINELEEYDEKMELIRNAQMNEFQKKLDEFDKETNFRIIEKSEDEFSNSNASTSNDSDHNNTVNSTDQINSENPSIENSSTQNQSNRLSKIYPNLPPSFRKHSQRLLDLREREKVLLKTRRFEEAGYTRIEADELESAEIEQFKINYIRSREDKRAKLIDEHKQKMECFEENCARIRKRLQTENETRINALQKAKDNFQGKIDSLEFEIKGTLSMTQAPSPLPSRPMTPHRSPDNYTSTTFMTQQNVNKQKNRQKSENAKIDDAKTEKKKRAATVMGSPQIVYRPIPSKWRFQTPMVLKMYK